MNKEEVKNLIKRLKRSPGGDWYQSYSIGGEEIDGRRDTAKRLKQFKFLDMTGLNVLDIGCNIGSMALEIKRRNANTVIGVDKLESNIQCARALAGYENLDVEFLALDVNKPKEFLREVTSRCSKFDYVLALALVHWVDHRKLAYILNHLNVKHIFFEGRVKKCRNKRFMNRFVKKNNVKVSKVRYVGRAKDGHHRLVWRLTRR